MNRRLSRVCESVEFSVIAICQTKMNFSHIKYAEKLQLHFFVCA